jgi:hypothetical protein
MNQLVVSLIVILLPGIIATIISDKVAAHSKWDSFKFSLYSLILGIISYAFLQLIYYSWDILLTTYFHLDKIIWTHLRMWNNAMSAQSDLSAWEICWASVLSMPVALIASSVINYKFFTRFAQRYKLSYKYGDENLYSYYLSAKEIEWVTVRDSEKNLTYEGKVAFHSENDKIQEIVLSQVSVYRYEDSTLLYSLPTIYLSRDAGKFTIEAISPERLGSFKEE